jgi:hypothetical protein
LQTTMLRRHAWMDHCSMEALVLVLVFSIIFKVSLSNQIQETGSSVDIPRLLSAVAFLLLDTNRKRIKGLSVLGTFAMTRCELDTNEERQRKTNLGPRGSTRRPSDGFPINRLMRVTGSRGCALVTPRGFSIDHTVTRSRTDKNNRSRSWTLTTDAWHHFIGPGEY